jgi:hypothetical protein
VKIKGTKIGLVINRIHVACLQVRDDVMRALFIPDKVRERRKYDPERRTWQQDVEAAEGGQGCIILIWK